jgi:predicted secreted protein
MARPPAPYTRARVVTTLINSTIWSLLLYLTCAFSGGGKLEHMSPLEMANVTALTFLFIPYFTTHGVLMSLFNGVLKGSIIMPEATQDARAEAGTANPWRLATINAFVFGLVPAGIGYFIAIRADAATMTRGAFAGRYALAGALLCASVAWVVSGQPLLRTLRTPREKRGFLGTPDQYLWRYFALPHGIANTIINGVLAFALSPVPFAQAGAIVPTQHIVGDTVIALVVLTLLLASGARSQARNETLLGIAPPGAAAKRSVLNASLRALFCGFAFAVVVGVFFWLTKLPGLDIFSWAAYRAVVFGVYAGWLTKGVAQAAINSTLNAEPVASPASTAAA